MRTLHRRRRLDWIAKLNLSFWPSAQSYNGKTYFFANGSYWRFDEEEEKTEADYPRDMSVWAGIPRDLDAAFTWRADGLTYFTRKNEFYKFKNSRMRAIEEPAPIARNWFGHYCR